MGKESAHLKWNSQVDVLMWAVRIAEIWMLSQLCFERTRRRRRRNRHLTAILPVYTLHQQSSQKLVIFTKVFVKVFETWTMFNFMGIQFHEHDDAFASFVAKALLNLWWLQGQRMSQMSSHYCLIFLYYTTSVSIQRSTKRKIRPDIDGESFLRLGHFMG